MKQKQVKIVSALGIVCFNKQVKSLEEKFGMRVKIIYGQILNKQCQKWLRELYIDDSLLLVKRNPMITNSSQKLYKEKKRKS